MNSKVKLKDVDTGQMIECELVYPEDANPEQNKISILAPAGLAMFGYSVGDSIQWPASAGVRILEIDKILYQPEAAGHYDL
jgi:regulator of nucleoside diphosphate kinase